MKDRFHGIGRVYGRAALECLSEASVMVVGIGGVGWKVTRLRPGPAGSSAATGMLATATRSCGTVSDSVHVARSQHRIERGGAHTLKLWRIDPGVVFQRIELWRDEPRESYLGPVESARR